MRGICFGVILFAGSLLSAQEAPECLERTIPIQLAVRGHRMAEMTRLRYQATVEGRPVEILSSSVITGPKRVYLVIDTSGSMGPGHHPIGTRKTAVEFAFELGADAVRSLPPTASMALMLFGKQEEKLDFATRREALLQRLDLGRPAILKSADGRTALFDAIRDALLSIPSPQPGDAVYVITDGGDNRSQTEPQKLVRLLQAGGIRLFVFLLDQGLYSSEEVGYKEDLRRMAERSGGLFAMFGGNVLPTSDMNPVSDFTADARRRAQLEAALPSFYQALASPTLLRIRLARAPSRFQSWKLEVIDEQGRVQKDVSLSYPRELAPCARR